MRGGVEQVLDVVVEPLGLVAHHAGERMQPLVADSAGAFDRMVAAPRIEASGVRSSCDTEPISASRSSSVSDRILASLSARATSSRSSVAAASVSASSMRWRMLGERSAGDIAEVDGDHAEIRRLRRHPANEPDIAFAVADGALEAFVAFDARHFGPQPFRHALFDAGLGAADSATLRWTNCRWFWIATKISAALGAAASRRENA